LRGAAFGDEPLGGGARIGGGDNRTPDDEIAGAGGKRLRRGLVRCWSRADRGRMGPANRIRSYMPLSRMPGVTMANCFPQRIR
jgi:hypothetical protein